MGRDGVDRIHVIECRDKWQDFMNIVVNLLSSVGEFLD